MRCSPPADEGGAPVSVYPRYEPVIRVGPPDPITVEIRHRDDAAVRSRVTNYLLSQFSAVKVSGTFEGYPFQSAGEVTLYDQIARIWNLSAGQEDTGARTESEQRIRVICDEFAVVRSGSESILCVTDSRGYHFRLTRDSRTRIAVRTKLSTRLAHQMLRPQSG